MERGSFQTFLRGIILFGFTLLLLQLFVTGSINLYISPTMQPFIYFAFVVFLFLSIIQIVRSVRESKHTHDHEHDAHCQCEHDHQVKGSMWKKVAIYAIFIFPLLTGFIFPDKPLDSSVADRRGVTLGSGKEASAPLAEAEPEVVIESSDVAQKGKTSADYFELLEQSRNAGKNNQEEDEHFSLEDTYSFDGFDDFYSNMARELAGQDKIVITDDNYLDVLTVVDIYLYDLMGKQIEVEGFVYRLPGIKFDEFVVARFAMTCCTADSEVYGFLTKGEATRAYQNDDWVRVTGTLTELEFDGWMYPALEDITVVPIEAPESPYVFYNFFN